MNFKILATLVYLLFATPFVWNAIRLQLLIWKKSDDQASIRKYRRNAWRFFLLMIGVEVLLFSIYFLIREAR